jgi:hypothetical protein
MVLSPVLDERERRAYIEGRLEEAAFFRDAVEFFEVLQTENEDQAARIIDLESRIDSLQQELDCGS